MAVPSSNFCRIECRAGQTRAFDRSAWVSPGNIPQIFLQLGSCNAVFCIFLFLIPKSPSHQPAPSLQLGSSVAGVAGDRMTCPTRDFAGRTRGFGTASGAGQPCSSAAADAAPSLVLHTQTEKGNHLCVPLHTLLIPTELGNLPGRSFFPRGQILARPDF